MTNLEVLKEFWYDLVDDEKNVILNNCHEEYDKFLMGKDFDVEIVKKYVKTNSWKFIQHAEGGHLEFVKMHIQLGVDIHANKNLALRLSANFGHLDVVKYLVEHGADIHAENDEALKFASGTGKLNVVKYLKSLS